MMRHIYNELSERARRLAERDGYCHEIVNDGPTYQVLLTPELNIYISKAGVLTIQDNVTAETVYVEGTTGNLVATSPDKALERALRLLQQRMILDDLADV
jgi:hypothetical protein